MQASPLLSLAFDPFTFHPVYANMLFKQCDGARPTCSSCRAKDYNRCVYEAGIDGSRIQQLRKHNQDLKVEIASLQNQLSKSWAEKNRSRKRKKDDGPTSPEQVSPMSDQRSELLDFSPSSPPYSKVELESRFQQIRAGDRGQRALSNVTKPSVLHLTYNKS